jgi:hypothetical protein
MGQRYTFNYLWIILIATAISINFAFALRTDKYPKADTIYTRKPKVNAKQSYFKNGLNVGTLPQIKPSPYANIKQSIPVNTDKLLTNVQVYPALITDQINLKYVVSRNTNVTIEIMDVLGNNVARLFSDRVELGEKTYKSNMSVNKLTSGFYFLRVKAGTESVIKRITIL